MNIGTMMTILSNSCFNEEGGGNMDINQIIETYLNSLSKEERENTHIERYSFGNTPEMEDELAQLVAKGEKKATTSLLALYDLDNERIPEKGDLNVILDSKGNEVCVTRNIKVYSVPFREVSDRKIGLTTSTRASSGKTVVEAGVITWKEPCVSLFRI